MSALDRLLWIVTFGLSRRLDDLLNEIRALGATIMASFDEMKAELVAIYEATTEIAADLDDVIAKLGAATGGVLTQEQADEIVNGLKSTSESLKAVASKWTPGE